MSIIRIKSYAKTKQSTSSGGGSSSIGFSQQPTGIVQGVNIWGRYHDHTSDIEGDMTGVGSITMQGDINGADGVYCENAYVTSKVNAATVETSYVSASEADITTLQSTDIMADNINADDGNFENIDAENGDITYLNTNTANIHNLTVTGQAHFFELIIDKVKSVGGQIILSAANAKVYDVDKFNYKLYWKATDTTKGISNEFEVGDQVLCQTFNQTAARTGLASNKYYWALVTAVGVDEQHEDPITHEIGRANWIQVDDEDYDGTLTLQNGDEIVQLGNRTNTARQNAIILAAYDPLDASVTAPAIVQYTGINDYNLSHHKVNVISANDNTFYGNFNIINNGTYEDLKDILDDITTTPTYYVLCSRTSFPGDVNQQDGLTYPQGNYQFEFGGWKLNGDSQPTHPTNMMLHGYRIWHDSNNQEQSAPIFRGSASQNYTGYLDTTLPTEQIQFKLTDYSDETIVYAILGIPIIVAGETIDGADGESWRLYPVTESLTADYENHLIVNLIYRIQHNYGANMDFESPSLNDFHVIGHAEGSQLTFNFNINRQDSYYNLQTDYDIENSPQYYIIELLNYNNEVIDRRYVPVLIQNTATLSVTDSILARVQGTETDINNINGDLTTINNNISQLQVDVNGINATVSQHSTQINTINGEISDLDYSVGQIDIKADNILIQVKSGLSQTGINIDDHQITLNGDTVVDGQLSVVNGNGFVLEAPGYDQETTRTYIVGSSIEGLSQFLNRQTDISMLGSNGFELKDDNVRIYLGSGIALLDGPNGLRWNDDEGNQGIILRRRRGNSYVENGIKHHNCVEINSTNYTIQDTDDFVLVTRSGATINFPNTTEAIANGQQVIIRNNSNGNITLNFAPSYVYIYGDTNGRQTYSLGRGQSLILVVYHYIWYSI